MKSLQLPRRSMVAFLAAASLASAWSAQAAPEEGVLDNAAFDALLANPARVLIVDVRRPDEIAANGGFAVYLNVQPADLESKAAFIPRDRTLITVSNHAARAKKAAISLRAAGFTVAGAIGAQTYEEAGGKLIHLAKPATAP